MIEHRALITIASWEDRFRLGTERLIRQSYPPTAILMFYYREYGKRSLHNRNWVKTLCAAQSIRIDEVEVSFDPLDAWLKYTSTLRSYEFRTNEVLLDFTTAPREAIWTLMYLITRAGVGVSYVYHTPEAYNPDWLSRDSGEPRFMFKMSGLQDVRKPTILMVMTGFDPDRTEQLVTFYEPKLTLLGIQTGRQYKNTKLNIERHERVLKAFADVEAFEVDVYGTDHGFGAMERKVVHHKRQGNLILSSLGPKPSAIAFFKLWMQYPEIALAYAPSNEYMNITQLVYGRRLSPAASECSSTSKRRF